MIVPRLVLHGDKTVAAKYKGLAMKFLREVERDKGNKFQLRRRKKLNNGGMIEIKHLGDIPEIHIVIPFESKPPIKVGITPRLRPPVYIYMEMAYIYVIGVFWEQVNRCSVYDVANERVALDVPLNSGSGYATFPCSPTLISDWVNYSSSMPDMVPPLTPVGYYSQVSHPWNAWSDWDDPPSRLNDCTDNNSSHTRTDSKSATLNTASGASTLFTDTYSEQCLLEYIIDGDYHSGHDDCCIVNSSYCTDYSATTGVKVDSHYHNYTYRMSHGMRHFSHGHQFDFWWNIPRRSCDVFFTHGPSGGGSVYTTADIVLYYQDYEDIISKTWALREDSCRNPGGIVLHDEWYVSYSDQTKTEEFEQSIKNLQWHTPYGTYDFADYGENNHYRYTQAKAGMIGGLTKPDSQSVSGRKTTKAISVVANPPKPGGLTWSDGSILEGGNAYFIQEDGYLPQYTTFLQIHGYPYYYYSYHDYRPEIKDPWTPLASNWGWNLEAHSIQEVLPSFRAGILFPVGNGENPEDIIPTVDPHSIGQDANFSHFLDELAWATIQAAPWGGNKPWEGGHYIRYGITPHLNFKKMRIIPYPFVKKDEVV